MTDQETQRPYSFRVSMFIPEHVKINLREADLGSFHQFFFQSLKVYSRTSRC